MVRSVSSGIIFVPNYLKSSEIDSEVAHKQHSHLISILFSLKKESRQSETLDGKIILCLQIFRN